MKAAVTYENGEMHSLSDYQGRKVILYFYPKDMTAGCTKQACGFRTTYLIDENGIIVKASDKVKAADNPAQMLGELS